MENRSLDAQNIEYRIINTKILNRKATKKTYLDRSYIVILPTFRLHKLTRSSGASMSSSPLQPAEIPMLS